MLCRRHRRAASVRPVTQQQPFDQPQADQWARYGPQASAAPPQYGSPDQGFQQAPAPQAYATAFAAPVQAPAGYPAQQGYAGQYGPPDQVLQPAPVSVAAPQPAMQPPAGQLPWGPTPKRPIVLEVVVVILGGLLASIFVLIMAASTGGAAVGAAILCSLVPLATVGAVLLWIDKWEPEPRILLVAAFLWGGGVAVGVASLLNGAVGPAVAAMLGLGMDPDTASGVFGAPLVEEGMKGLGVLVIFLLRRRQFNGPVDGIVYAGVVALGFAVVEDVQYFAMNYDSLGLVFVMRAILGPFGHLIYTLPMGIALGLASRHRSRTAWVWMYPIGYVIGVSLHMAWNGSLSSVQGTLGELFMIYLFLDWVPLAALTAVVVWLRRRESAIITARLWDYVPSGWMTPEETQSLASMRANVRARQWAGRLGQGMAAAMRRYQQAAIRLAYARQDLYTGHTGIRARTDEIELLNEMAQARSEVMARSTPQPGY